REGEETHMPPQGQQRGSGARGSQLVLGKCGEGDRVYQFLELVDGERGEIICHGRVSEQDVSEELAPDESIAIGQGEPQGTIHRDRAPEEQIAFYSLDREAGPAPGALSEVQTHRAYGGGGQGDPDERP